ncbi:MAG: carotenoid biosynthesis protein [Chthoniobacteraceae bacterium]
MPRSVVSRSLEPLVAVLWGVFLVWTVWLAVVWIAPVGASALGLVEGAPVPANADLRRAVLLLADNADVAWLALAVMNLHLVLTRAHGLWTARSWLAFSAGGALVLGVLNAKTGLPFGHLHFGGALGVKLLGVPFGWVLLWPVLVMSARESVLWMRPRASHRVLALLTAVVVLATAFNLEWPARFVRGWWIWQSDDARSALGVPWLNWLSWFAWPGLMALAMREKDVLSGVAARSGRPVLILAALNAIALVARLRLG